MISSFGYEDFHLLTKNPSHLKHIVSAHKFHYDVRILRLQAEAPLLLRTQHRIKLDRSCDDPKMCLRETITRRRSSRRFGKEALSIQELSNVLYLANGVQTPDNRENSRDLVYERNVPNSGNLGSVEIFPIVLTVRGIPAGVYHYDSLANELAILKKGDFRTLLKEEILFQPEFADASVVLIMTSAVGRLAEKYGARGYRLGLLDVGHASQNINLTSVALQLNVCPTAGYIDDAVEILLGIDGITTCVFLMIAIGPRYA